MTVVPYSDRVEFFKYQSAAISFEMVGGACNYLIEHKLLKTHPIYDSMLTSIYTLYSRPFRQRKDQGLRLETDLVPQQHRGTHSELITLRDQMFAHTDTDGPITVDGLLINELAGFTRNGSTKFGISVVTPVLSVVLDLAVMLAKATRTRADAIWRIHMSRERVPDGTTIVNLSRQDGPFLIPHPLLSQ